MRPAPSAPRFAGRAFIGLLAVAVLGPSAWAYVNGGDYHSTLKTFERKLKTKGWGVSFATPLPADTGGARFVAKGVKADPDNPEYQRYVNQLIERALKSLPAKDADRISAAAKREVARLAQQAILDAAADNREVIAQGRTGSVKYRVGVGEFESWWETNYGGKHEIHARQTGLVPFVALKVVDAEA